MKERTMSVSTKQSDADVMPVGRRRAVMTIIDIM